MDKLSDKHSATYQKLAGPKPKSMVVSVNADPYTKAVRKSAAHAFSSREVGRMNKISTKYVDEWLDGRLAMLVEKEEPFDPAVEFNRITFKVICEAAFEYVPTDEEFESFQHHLHVFLTEHLMKQSINPIRKTFWFLYPAAREARESLEALLQFSGTILQSYRNKPQGERSANSTLIKILHDLPAIESELQRRSEVLDWIITGYDTVGYTLANMAVLVSKNPNIQDKLRKELSKVSSPEGCDYFKNVVKESSRVMPTAAGGSLRVTGRDFTIKETGEIIPKGTICFTNQYIMNHNPSVYGRDVDDFIPERWNFPTEEMTHALAPFSLGTRCCPGQALAMAEINNILPRLLSKYNLEVVEEGTKSYFLILKFQGSKILAKQLHE